MMMTNDQLLIIVIITNKHCKT